MAAHPRQPDDEARAAGAVHRRAALHRDLSAVADDDVANDGEAQPRAGADALRRPERIPYPFADLIGNSHAVVFDLEHCRQSLAARPNIDASAVVPCRPNGRLGVVEQVQNDLLELRPIANDSWEVVAKSR